MKCVQVGKQAWEAAVVGAKVSDWSMAVQRRVASIPVTNTSSTVFCDGHPIHLVGTSHISEQSANEVRETILRLQPKVVMVELCKGRLDVMRHHMRQGSSGSVLDQALREVRARLGGFNLPAPVSAHVLGAIESICRGVGIEPGVDMRAAVTTADKVGARLVCGDRDVATTMSRGLAGLQAAFGNISALSSLAMARMGASPALAELTEALRAEGKQFGPEVFTDVAEQLKSRRTAHALTEVLKEVLPGVHSALVAERDEHMADQLQEACRGLKKDGSIVGVVGLAHLDGLERLFMERQLHLKER